MRGFDDVGVKIKQAGQSAGSLAKDAGENVAEAAEKVGSLVKSRWALIKEARQRQPAASRGETMQERLLSAAATTGLFLRKGVSETKEKVVVGKMKVEEVKEFLIVLDLFVI